MHEFIQGGELKVQAKRLLGYRMPLILVIIVNIVLILRVPIPSARQAQAQDPASSSWNELETQIGAQVPEVALSLAQSVPAANSQNPPHEKTPLVATTEPDNLPSTDNGLTFINGLALDTGLTLDTGLVLDAAINDPPTADATLPLVSLSPAELASNDSAVAEPESVVMPELPTVPLSSWKQDAQQLVQQWQHSAQSLLSQHRTPSESDVTVPGVEDEFDIPSLEITPAEPSSPVGDTVNVPAPPSNHDENVLHESSLAVRNPLANTETIRFLVNGRLYELQPGEAHQFPPAEQWLIQFHPGGEFQDVDRTMTRGIYEFVVTEQGWNLVPVDKDVP